jgi:hypothetical protein
LSISALSRVAKTPAPQSLAAPTLLLCHGEGGFEDSGFIAVGMSHGNDELEVPDTFEDNT